MASAPRWVGLAPLVDTACRSGGAAGAELGAGAGAFSPPPGAGTVVAEGKETRLLNGREHLLEYAHVADFALIRARRADRFGNLVYRGASRNFNPLMAMAARVTIAEVDEIVEV